MLHNISSVRMFLCYFWRPLIIVKACPAIEQTGQDHKPDAVMGYYADPISQRLIYDNERSPTKGEREAYFATQHCIDVPIPPEVTTSGQVSADLTMAECIGHRGYTVVNIESGKHVPSSSTLISIQRALESAGIEFAEKGIPVLKL